MRSETAGLAVEVADVVKRFGTVEVLKGVSLSIPEGGATCIIGASGSGKSTLLRCMNGLESIDAGAIHIAGMTVGHKSTDLDALRAKVGMVFQQFNLFPHLSAVDNVGLALRRVRGLSRSEARERGMVQLERVGLQDFADRRPAQLSGGQQQRVAIARALAMEPEVMLFDEATSALDPELVKGVLNIMRQLAEEGMTMVVVTHEMRFAREVASQVVFLDKGVVDTADSPEEVFDRPASDRLSHFLSQVL